MALKVTVVEPAGTVTEDDGTGSSELLLESDTAVPPVGAVWFSVTEHVVLAPLLRLVGLQDIDDSTTGAVRLITAVLDVPLRVAVSVAL